MFHDVSVSHFNQGPLRKQDCLDVLQFFNICRVFHWQHTMECFSVDFENYSEQLLILSTPPNCCILSSYNEILKLSNSLYTFQVQQSMRVEQVIQQVQEKVPGTQPKSSKC